MRISETTEVKREIVGWCETCQCEHSFSGGFPQGAQITRASIWSGGVEHVLTERAAGAERR